MKICNNKMTLDLIEIINQKKKKELTHIYFSLYL